MPLSHVTVGVRLNLTHSDTFKQLESGREFVDHAEHSGRVYEMVYVAELQPHLFLNYGASAFRQHSCIQLQLWYSQTSHWGNPCFPHDNPTGKSPIR